MVSVQGVIGGSLKRLLIFPRANPQIVVDDGATIDDTVLIYSTA